MRLFDDPLKTIVDGMVQAHGIRQQMLQARMEQARAKMMERDMARREEDSQRDRQMQDIQFQQQMGDAARPVNGGTVEDPNPLPFAAPGMDAPASLPILRKPDASRLVKYKRADGQQMQYELLTPEEQQSKGLERLKAEQAAKIQAEEARQLRLRQILGPVELAQKRAELEMQSGFQDRSRKAQQDFTASESDKNRKAQSDAQKATMTAAEQRASAANKTRLDAARIAASRPRGGGGGGGAASDSMVQAVMANPQLFQQLTPTQRTALIPQLQAAGFQGFGKDAAAGDIRKLGELQSALEGVGELRSVMEKGSGYVGPIAGYQSVIPWSEGRQVQASIDLIRQKVGRALEGGVLRKEDEEKYKKILPTINDTMETAKYKISMLEQELQRDIGTLSGANQGVGRRVPAMGGGAPAASGNPYATPAGGGAPENPYR